MLPAAVALLAAFAFPRLARGAKDATMRVSWSPQAARCQQDTTGLKEYLNSDYYYRGETVDGKGYYSRNVDAATLNGKQYAMYLYYDVGDDGDEEGWGTWAAKDDTMRVSWSPQAVACQEEWMVGHVASINGDYFYQEDRSDGRAYYARGPNLADSFFQMAPDDDPDKFFCVSGSAGGAGGGSSKQMEKKKGGEDYNSEEYMEDWCGNDLSCKHTTTLSWDGLCTGTMALGWAQQAGVHDQEVEQG
eukprot:gene11163-5987_t